MALRDPDIAFPVLQPRLKCLIHIVKKLTAEHEEFITALVPEVRGASEGCVCVWGVLWNVVPKGLSRSGEGSTGAGDGLNSLPGRGDPLPAQPAPGHKPQGGQLKRISLRGCLGR